MTRYVLHPDHEKLPVGQKLIRKADLCQPQERAPVVLDFTEYNSAITGEPIEDRGAHREHLKRHGAEEVGSETPDWIKERKYRRRHGATEDADLPDPARDRRVAVPEDSPVDFAFEDYSGP